MDIIRQALGLSPPTPTNLTDYISVALRTSTGHNAKASIINGVASFYSNKPDKIYSLKIGINPQQTGSGDPSPENVRPISGRTGATIYHSGEDTGDTDILTIAWETEAGTVYGGTLDATTGLLAVNTQLVTITGGCENANVGYTRFKVGDLGYIDDSITAISNRLVRQGGAWNRAGLFLETNSTARNQALIYLKLFEDSFSSQTACTNASNELLAQWAAEGTPLQVAFGIAAAQTYQLTPQQLNTLLGVNNIWADTGPVIELLY